MVWKSEIMTLTHVYLVKISRNVDIVIMLYIFLIFHKILPHSDMYFIIDVTRTVISIQIYFLFLYYVCTSSLTT